MGFWNKRLFTTVTFSVATAVLIVYLLSMRWHISLPVTIFWGSIALMLGTTAYQCLNIESFPSYTKVTLLQIVTISFVFHLIYQIPFYGVRGYDAYMDMGSAKGIINSGFVMGDSRYINVTSTFPIIHILGVMLSLITGIDIFSVAKWFPSILDTILILLSYLLIRRIFEKEKVALFSVLLFACLEHHILWSSLYVRETVALILAICCIYLYFSANSSSTPSTHYALSILCLISTIFAHHLTSLMLSIFLAVHFLTTKVSKAQIMNRTFFKRNLKGQAVTSSFVLLSFVVLFSYWMYVVSFPFYTIATLAAELFNPTQWGSRSYAQMAGISGTSIRTLRGNIEFYGFYIFHSIFALIMLFQLLHRGKSRRIETYSFTLFFFLCGIIGFSSLYLIPAAVFPDRFLMYGWIFGFAPLVTAILEGKHKLLRRSIVILMIAFMLYNLYIIDPVNWDLRAEGVTTVASFEDYSLANTINFSNVKIFGYQNPLMAVYDVQGELGNVLSVYKVNIAEFGFIIIQKKSLALEPITALVAIAENNSSNYNKIYESNSLSVFRLKR